MQRAIRTSAVLPRLSLGCRGGAPIARHRRLAYARWRGRGGGVLDWLKGAFNWVKDNKIISKGLSLIPHPLGQAGSVAAKIVGLGRRRPRRLY